MTDQTNKQNRGYRPSVYQNREKRITCVLGSVTVAMKARNLLFSQAISSNVVKVSSSNSTKGCVYGISLSIQDKQTATDILKRDRFKIINYLYE